MRSGVPVELPGGKQLIIGTLSESSPCRGKSIGSCFLLDHQDEIEVIAIFRQEQTLLPHPGVVLRTGDRLLIITSPGAREQLVKHFAPISPPESLERTPALTH